MQRAIARSSALSRLFAVTAAALLLCPAAAYAGDEPDEIEGPWGTVHANLSGTASSDAIPWIFESGQVEEKWRLDIVGLGHDRPGGRSSIAFDKDGNIYWISSTGGGTGGLVRILSASPDGQLRWSGNDGQGGVHALGSIFSSASPVVGVKRVYGTGDSGGSLIVAAYDKATGENLWTANPTPAMTAYNQTLTPALYQGKITGAAYQDGVFKVVYQIDAESGNVDWVSTVDEVDLGTGIVGQMAFVPDAFGEGIHGLYFNGERDPNATGGLPAVFGIRVDPTGGASLGWSGIGGKVARSHMIYSETTNSLYALTWSDFGAQVYIYSPQTGFIASYRNTLNSGHGFYDVGGLDFDGTTVIGGAFDGIIFRYNDLGGGVINEQVIFKGGFTPDLTPYPFWGETRVLGSLIQGSGGETVLVTATNSSQCCASHVVAVDVTNGVLLWEHDSGVVWPHQFQYAGGPLVGPDGKVYYFPRYSDGTTALVAIGPAADQKPAAGFIAVDAAKNEIAAGACPKAGDLITVDGSCSTGGDMIYRYSIDAPEVATITQASEDDPRAEIRFKRSGTFIITLEVENAVGTDSCSLQICIEPVPPQCRLTVTDLEGGAIDNLDDADAIPCLPAGGTAKADASESIGDNLEYIYTVTPSAGVDIDQGGDTMNPVALITIADPGTYRIALTTQNDLGKGNCIVKTICVKQVIVNPEPPVNLTAVGGSKQVTLTWSPPASGPTPTGYIIYRGVVTAPIAEVAGTSYTDTGLEDDTEYCYRVRSKTEAAQSVDSPEACARTEKGAVKFRRADTNDDGKVDLSDAIVTLSYLFQGGTTPTCFDAADADDSGVLDLTDGIFPLTWLFQGGPEPPAPGPKDCGPDTTPQKPEQKPFPPCGYTKCL